MILFVQCSSCPHYDFICNGHSNFNSSAPVYDRITSRKSLYYDDHPYEMYSMCQSTCCEPHSSHQATQIIQPRSHLDSGCSKNRSHASSERNVCQRYLEDTASESRITRRDVFNPRNSLRLIYNFKDWVSCLVSSTNKKKSKSKIILGDQKSITRVIFARQSCSSQSLTGERLSSFADYASINVNKSSKHTAKSASSKNAPAALRKSKKKRAAPLPPIPDKSFNRVENKHSLNSKNTVDSLSKYDSKKSSAVKECNSVADINRTVSLRRRRKKRRAPLPPHALNSTSYPVFENAVITKGKNLPLKNKFVQKSSNDKNASLSEIKTLNGTKSSNQITNLKVAKERQKNILSESAYKSIRDPMNCYRDYNYEASDGDESSSVSFSDGESYTEKYGPIKYCAVKKRNSFKNNEQINQSSNIIQYSDTEGDVRLKISFQKTETNVVTVEELPTSRDIHSVTKDYSSSESSEEADDVFIKRSILPCPQKPKQSSTDSSSLSVEETSDGSKTIFEELQLKSPVKGSVKEFVQAFNMLADKSISYPNKQNFKVEEDKPISSSKKLSQYSNDVRKIDRNIYSNPVESVPTKWEYQNNNKLTNLVPSSNKCLLPIAEESINETSEHEESVDDDDVCHETKSIRKKYRRKFENNGLTEVNKKGGNLPYPKESNVQKSSLTKTPWKQKKYFISDAEVLSKKGSRPSKASIAALTSLMTEKEHFKLLEDTPSPSASLSKRTSSDHPVMVGLYIEDKSSHRGPIPLLVTPSMSLKELKNQVETEYNIPCYQQCWIFGESFAVQDEISLASYGVTEPGSPILLYVMSKEAKTNSLRNAPHRHCQSKVDSSEIKDSKISKNTKDHEKQKSHLSLYKKDESKEWHSKKSLDKKSSNQKSWNRKKAKSEYHKTCEEDYEKKTDYHSLVALDDVDLVPNGENFECPICFLAVASGKGVVLQDCLHSFCKECLAEAVRYSETAMIKCPFRNNEYSCESHLQEREIKCLVTPDVYERHLQRSMALAESQAQDSFHCKTPDCPGWCLFEDNVNTFLCPVCKRTNCLTCAAIHEGKNCKQYQDYVAFSCDTNEEAKKTKEYLESMVQNGEAMECPQCQVILMKKWGCDWLKCSMCHTEVCWVTKGPRWGPGGKGDTSGGCKCMLNGVRCHPKCSYCH